MVLTCEVQSPKIKDAGDREVTRPEEADLEMSEGQHLFYPIEMGLIHETVASSRISFKMKAPTPDSSMNKKCKTARLQLLGQI